MSVGYTLLTNPYNPKKYTPRFTQDDRLSRAGAEPEITTFLNTE